MNNLKLGRQGVWVFEDGEAWSMKIDPQIPRPAMSLDDRREIARRIVACVNACAAYPTEDVEAVARLGGIPAVKAGIEVQLGFLKNVTAQRDELLAALLAFRDHVPDNRHASLAQVDPFAIDQEVLDQIDAAIAKAKGAA